MLRVRVRIPRSRLPGKSGPIRLLIGVDASADAAQALRAMACASGRREPKPGWSARLMRAFPSPSAVLRRRTLQPKLMRSFAPGSPSCASRCRRRSAPSRPGCVAPIADRRSRLGLQPKKPLIGTPTASSLARRGPIHRIILGSVSSEVAAHAHCSVEVIRHPASGNR